MIKNNNKKKAFTQIFVALFVVALLGVLGITNGIKIVHAATDLTAVLVEGVSASYDEDNNTMTYSGSDYGGSCTVVGSGTSITGTAKGYYKKISCVEINLEGGFKLYLKNDKNSTGELSFDYNISYTGLEDSTTTLKIGNTTYQNGTGHYAADLGSGSTLTIQCKSAKGTSSVGSPTKKIEITNLFLKIVKNATITFLEPVNGSYTVNGNSINSNTQFAQTETTTYTVNATPASGYKFVSWYGIDSNGNETQLSDVRSASLILEDTMSVYPKFIQNSEGAFQVENTIYTTLNSAITAAEAATDKTIIVVADTTVPSGNYTISSGITLLIPFSFEYLAYTDEPEVVVTSHVNPTAYRTLTMSSGANITVSSGAKICVPSKLSAVGQGSGSWNGTPTGNGGRIVMNSDSSIVLNGGGLYCYGYITGSGAVTANSGSTVYECFQIRSWRGGTATSNMINGTIFPFNQYYIQNIEVPLTINAGATERIYTSVNVANASKPTGATFIGSDGLFRISSGYIKKTYIASTDRIKFEINGNASIYGMSLSLAGQTVNTKDYVMPINSNFDIDIQGGTTTIGNNQDLAMLPASKLSISSGATLTISSGSDVYVYDEDQWGPYAGQSLNLIPVGYSVSNGTNTIRTNSSLTDAIIDNNGTINISGTLYTTSSGASIMSSLGTGKISYKASAGTKTSTQQATQSGTDMTNVNIGITSAILQNGSAFYDQSLGATKTMTLKLNGQSTFAEYTVQNTKTVTTTSAVNGTTYYFCYDPNHYDQSGNNLNPTQEIAATYGWWDTRNFTSETEPSTAHVLTFVVGETQKTFDYEEGTGFVFPCSNTSATNSSWVPSTENTIKMWECIENGEFYEAGRSYGTNELDFVTDMNFIPFFGGWYYENSKNYYVDYSTGQNLKGIQQIGQNDGKTINNTIVVPDGALCLFDEETGEFKTNFTGLYTVAQSTYYVETGLVMKGYGLINVDNYLFFVKEDGTIVTNTTFYVPASKINSYKVNDNLIQTGLYYFDSNGHMWYGNNLLDDDHEFGEINSGITKGGN